MFARTTQLLTAVTILIASAVSASGVRASARAEADSLRLTGRYAEAARAYARAAAAEPVAAALGTARCLAATGESEAALAALAAAAGRHDSAAALRGEAALLELERGRHDAARTHAEAALRADPDQCAARWVTAELHRAAGRLDEANDAYRWFVRYYNREQERIRDPEALRFIGRAAAQFARWNRNSGQFNFLVNDLYPDARKLEPRYWPAHLEAALLFIEKYNPPHARAELDSALATNPFAAELHAARARLALDDYQLDSTRAAIGRALALNPRLVVAKHLEADLETIVSGPRAAVPILEAALTLDPLNDETLGRLAAVRGAIEGMRDTLPGPRMGALIAEVTARNPHCGDFFAALAACFDRMQRYPPAARYYEEARRRMPQLVTVPGQLGLVLMRLGDEARAAELLDESHRVDPFNLRVRNTRRVLDLLGRYARLESEHFVIRYDGAKDSLLARWASRYLEERAYPQLVRDLGFRPEGKTLIEIFSGSSGTSGHGWFSARMVGLPFIGTVGACPGKMIAIASPNDMPSPFHWARVLQHELVHVINLQQTHFGVPRWFTEGLAVYHEGGTRPYVWEGALRRRAAAGRLYTLETIQGGFTRPATGEDWALAYCQAALYADYMVEAHGKDAHARLLAAYAGGLDTPTALERAFRVKVPAFEAGYRKFVDRVAAGYGDGAVPKTADRAELEALLTRDPRNPVVLEALAALRGAEGDSAKALELLERLAEAKGDDPAVRTRLSRLAIERGDWDAAARWAEDALFVDVKSAAAHADLGRARLERRRPAEAIESFEAAIALAPSDLASRLGLARACLEAKQADRARRALEELLRLDPGYPGAKEMLEGLG